MNVKICTTPTCGYCHQAKKYFSDRGIKFTEYDVSLNRAAADEIVRTTGQMGVPVIMIDDKVIVGFDRPKLESLLASGGNRHRSHLGIKIADASKIAQ